MWIYTKYGFFSIVSDLNHKGCLLVRARAKGDIEILWPEAKVRKTPGNDYLYRASIPANKVADVVERLTKDIDYPNFKATIDDPVREHYYTSVWIHMHSMQQELAIRDEKRLKTRKKK